MNLPDKLLIEITEFEGIDYKDPRNCYIARRMKRLGYDVSVGISEVDVFNSDGTITRYDIPEDINDELIKIYEGVIAIPDKPIECILTKINEFGT